MDPPQSISTTAPPAVSAGLGANWFRPRALLEVLRGLPQFASQERVVQLAADALTLVPSAYIFWLFNQRFLHSGFGYDEQFFVWGGWSITKGLAPYRDFLEFKPPFVFLTHALALKLFGFRDAGFKYFFTFFPLASILLLHLSMLSRKVDRVLSIALVAGIIQLFVNPVYHEVALTDTESIGLSYYLLATACLIARTPFRGATQAMAGAFLTCCVFSKEPFLPCAATTWLSALILERASGGNSRRYMMYTLLGAGVVVLGLCIYMIPTGAMKAYLAMATRYAKVYRDPVHSYCVVLGRFHPTTPLNDLKVQWNQAKAEFVNVPTLGFLTPFFVASCVFIWRRSVPLFVTSSVGVAAALWAVTASNCQFLHYYNMAMSGLFFFLVIGLDALSPLLWRCPRSIAIWTRAVPVVAVALHLGPRVDDERAVQYHSPPLVKSLSAVSAVPGILDIIAQETNSNDRIFTTGAPGLYVAADRLQGARESSWEDEIIAVYPGVTDEEKFKPIYDELVMSMPKVVVLDPEYMPRMTRHLAHVVTPFLTNFHYVKKSNYLYLRP
jgi:hypothetical protein